MATILLFMFTFPLFLFSYISVFFIISFIPHRVFLSMNLLVIYSFLFSIQLTLEQCGGLGVLIAPLAVKNPRKTSQLALHILGSVSMDPANHGLYSTGVYIYRKIWTLAVQTGVVQGSTVFLWQLIGGGTSVMISQTLEIPVSCEC